MRSLVAIACVFPALPQGNMCKRKPQKQLYMAMWRTLPLQKSKLSFSILVTGLPNISLSPCGLQFIFQIKKIWRTAIK